MYANIISLIIRLQRPTAKELLRHKFIMRAKRNNHLMDMIDRYKKWSLTHTNESDSDSDASGSNNGNDDSGGQDDSDWNLTVKGRITSTCSVKNICF